MRSERGVATVHALTVAAIGVLAAALSLQVTAVIGVRQRAAAAADLAALAASRAAVEGGEPCTVAARISRLNGAALTGCRTDAAVATVTVRVESGRWVVGRWASQRRARAAPAWYLD